MCNYTLHRCEFYSELLEKERDVNLIWTGRYDVPVFKFGVASCIYIYFVEGAGELLNFNCKKGAGVGFLLNCQGWD